MYLWDDCPLNYREFCELLEELPEFNVPAVLNPSINYYLILTKDRSVFFKQDNWDKAMQSTNLSKVIDTPALDWGL